MANYMPQYLFNICAVTAAKIAVSSDKTLEEAAQILSDNYKNSYDDQNLERDISKAAHEVIDFMDSALPGSSMTANMTQLQFTIVNFEPDGKKRAKKIFGGTWFNKQKDQIHNKVEQCKVNIATYHLLLVGGSLPLAPSGWSL